MVTQLDVTELKSLLTSGDRGGFYFKYYQLTGSEQALIQAQITTYSGTYGGAAVLGNQYAQEIGGANYDVTLNYGDIITVTVY